MLHRLVLALDSDGDGHVSLDEVESVGERALLAAEKAGRLLRKLWQHRSVRGGLGVIVLFYGGHFKTTAVVLDSIREAGAQELKWRWDNIVKEYRSARDRLEVEDPELFTAAKKGPGSQHGGSVEISTSAFQAVTLVAKPLLDSCLRFQSSMAAQVAMALNRNTARFGLGLQLGRRLTRHFGSQLERIFLGSDDEAVPYNHRFWISTMIDFSCMSVGLGVAWALQEWAALWTTCGLGAGLLVEAYFGAVVDKSPTDGTGDHAPPVPVYKQRWFHLLVADVSTIVGFGYQAMHFGKPPVPAVLWPLLAPTRVAEFGLASLT